MSLTDDIQVLVTDLEVIRAALNISHMQSVSQDLSDQYRKLSNRQQYSAMTKALEGSLIKADAYLTAYYEGQEEEANDE